MKTKFLLSLSVLFLMTISAFAADKLAIAEPVSKGGMKTEDIEAFWGILESSIKSDEYKLISRGALKQMLTEIGLTTSSDLVNLNSSQKAKLGQIETVKYILVSEIGKFGTQLNCTMKILDSSTGEIDQARTANLRVKNLDELADKIEATLEKLLSDENQLMASAILFPNIRVARAPAFLAGDFNIRLENSLLNNGVKLQNLQSVAKILKKYNLDNLYELEPKMFVKVGKLLEVQMLIQATITRFEIARIPYHVEETGARGVRYIGNIEGNIRIISAQKGTTIASVPFEERVNFRSLSRQETKDWTLDDYAKYMIKTVISAKILPELMKVSALQAK
ncbi:MAG: hypothetical protein PHS41_10355 [Victivallaceae bacterium]|nr:hypothetical protein [Victivallaceae bacterium]